MAKKAYSQQKREQVGQDLLAVGIAKPFFYKHDYRFYKNN